MASGGVFQLIANDGKGDAMITANQLLNQRIKDVMCARKQAGAKDITPTLADIERTHHLFVNAHFKPFAAIAQEYQKVRTQTGNPALNNTITFSIPQFGDFFHDMVGRQVLSAFNSSLQQAPAQGTTAPNGTLFPNDGEDWDGEDLLDEGQVTYSLVDPFGNPVGIGDDYRNMVRLCEYPGERLYEKVDFTVNGTPLDEYDDITVIMRRKFTIGADKITGYKKLVGQEVCNEAYSGPNLCYTTDSSNNAALPVTTFGGGVGTFANVPEEVPTTPQHSVNPVSRATAQFIADGFPDNAWDVTLSGNVNHNPDAGAAAFGYLSVNRNCLQYVDGPQTPKYQQPQIEIWNKLQFWFNNDVRLAIPSVSIPFGQRFITIKLAPQDVLAFEFPGLFIRQTIDSGAVENVATLNVRTVTYRPWFRPGTITDINLSNVELYVNNLFVNPEIHDIYIKRISFSLVRVTRKQKHNVNTDTSAEVQLTNLKYPIEFMFVGMRPNWNTNSQNPQQWRDWHRLTKVNDIVCDPRSLAETAQVTITVEADVITETLNPGETDHISNFGKVIPDTMVKELKTIDQLSVTAHGVKIYTEFPEKFYSAYTPFHFGGPNIITPHDDGAMMINFALYPGSYQPSGHINLSRAREFFLQWTTRYINATNPAELHVQASAINFLLITDGSATLRYTT